MAGIEPDEKVAMLKVTAPAKLNLTLEVLGKRPDGFHDIRSVVQAISLSDSLSFRLSRRVEIICSEPGWTAEVSLVSKAVSLLQETSRCSKGVVIRLRKRVPLLSGLGGDSSDAAATLRGLSRLWGLHLPRWTLIELASQLGSDVAFFIFGGTALVEGRGEVVTPLPALPHRWVVLLVPPVARTKGKTGRLYGGLKVGRFTEGQISDRLVDLIINGRDVASADFFNVFDGIADDNFKGLDKYRWHFLEAGARKVRLAGSGPTLFSLLTDKTQAEKIYRNLAQKGLKAYLAETLSGLEA